MVTLSPQIAIDPFNYYPYLTKYWKKLFIQDSNISYGQGQY